MKKQLTLTFSLLFCCSFSFLFSHYANASADDAKNLLVEQNVKAFTKKDKKINPDVLKLALNAYETAEKDGISISKPILTLIDYSLPSSSKRMWILDLINHEVLFNGLVAHGKYSGEYYATQFSDNPGSLQSSVGVFLTENTYIGHNGYTLKIKGLEHGFNENAESRRIVMHGAWYVSQELVKTRGAIGRSWGCPAIEEQYINPVINTIKDGSLLVAYAPDSNWLHQSKFINA
jgi:hypothetical protein